MKEISLRNVTLGAAQTLSVFLDLLISLITLFKFKLNASFLVSGTAAPTFYTFICSNLQVCRMCTMLKVQAIDGFVDIFLLVGLYEPRLIQFDKDWHH